MAKTRSLTEQMRQDHFVPDHKITFLVSVDKYDAVWKYDEKLKAATQFYKDLDHTSNDVKVMKACLRKYIPEAAKEDEIVK